MKICVYCVSVEGNDAAQWRTAAQCVSVLGTWPRFVMDRPVTPRRKLSRTAYYRSVFANHRRAMERFLETREDAASHLLILEDDCVFYAGARDRIFKSLEALGRWHPGWWTLHIGHLAVGPIVPVLGAVGLVRTTAPMTAHCVAYNGAIVPEILRRARVFGRPWVPEGNWVAPARARYALWPSAATQANPPKEFVMMFGPLATANTFGLAMDSCSLAMLLGPILITALFLARVLTNNHITRPSKSVTMSLP
jgi:hypothetical protein